MRSFQFLIPHSLEPEVTRRAAAHRLHFLKMRSNLRRELRIGLLPISIAIALVFYSASRQLARADTEIPRVKLGQAAVGLLVGPGMNASGKDLRGSVFIGQNLTGAVVDGCDLQGVRFFDWPRRVCGAIDCGNFMH